jgi:hypothetical protein
MRSEDDFKDAAFGVEAGAEVKSLLGVQRKERLGEGSRSNSEVPQPSF